VLTENGYKLPNGAASVLGSYIRQNMHFFVAKVNLASRPGSLQLSPSAAGRVRVAEIHAPDPPRTVNANGAQELSSTRSQLATCGDDQLQDGKTAERRRRPALCPQRLHAVYKALFTEQVKKEDSSAVFLEYAWKCSRS